MISLRLLGSIDLRDEHGEPIDAVLRRPKLLALLAYLSIARPRGFHRRDKLVAMFWPESSQERARHALRQAIYALRRELGEEAIVTRGDEEVGVNEHAFAVDVAACENRSNDEEAEGVAELYQGDLLDGFHLPGSIDFEDWLRAERVEIRRRVEKALHLLMHREALAGRPALAAQWGRRLLQLRPDDETTVHGVIQLLAESGDRTAALRTYEEFSARLVEEFELEPSPGLRAVVDRIRTKQSSRESARRFPFAAGKGQQTGAPLAPKVVLTLTVLVVLTGGGWIASRVVTDGRAPGDEVPRLAVLPFENLGAPEDAYFAAGITDEVRARLAGISALSVIARHSSSLYADTEKTPQQIGQELDVTYLLDATISWQRNPDGSSRVRVRPQLIQTADASQVWASVFERDYSEMFAIQAAIAEHVTHALGIVMSEDEQRLAMTQYTENAEAYESYLRGREFETRGWSERNFRSQILMFEEAVRLDKSFAHAYVALSEAHSNLVLWGFAETAEEHVRAAKSAAEFAAKLNPESPEARQALGLYHYVCCADYVRTLEYYQAARREQPGDTRLLMRIGNVLKRMGSFERALEAFRESRRLDPHDARPAWNAAQTLLWLRRYDEAESLLDSALVLNPQLGVAYVLKAWVYVLRDGNASQARRVLAAAAGIADDFRIVRLPFYLELLDRRYENALNTLDGTDAAGEYSEDGYLFGDKLRLALAHRVRGDSASARAYFNSSRAELAERLRADEVGARDEIAWRSALAIAYGGLGAKELAHEQIEYVGELEPPAIDAIVGPLALYNLAVARLLLGEHDQAIDQLAVILGIPARLTPVVLRLDPVWDPVRSHLGFRALVEEQRS